MANESVNSLAVDPGLPLYYTTSWRMMVEDYIPWLHSSSVVETEQVSDTDRYRYEADFYGYLTHVLKITAPELHYIMLRLNNMTHPREFGNNFPVILQVKPAFVTRMMELMVSFREA